MSVLRPAFARLLAFATAAVLVSVTTTGVGARQALDRTKPPAPGKTPDLRVPTWTKSALPDGADLIVSEKHDLPLVAFSLTFLGGANQFEPADKTGLASLTAAMMSEGTKSKDGEALSNALQLLGTSVSTSVAGESGAMSFVSTTDKLAQTLDIVADMLLNSTFPPMRSNGFGRSGSLLSPRLGRSRERLPDACSQRCCTATRIRTAGSRRRRHSRRSHVTTSLRSTISTFNQAARS